MKLIVFLLALMFINQSYSAVSNWTDFELHNGHITIPAKLNGVEGRAMLDSGSTANTVSVDYIKDHGSHLKSSGKMSLTGFYGTQRRRFYNGMNVELWGHSELTRFLRTVN